MLLHESTQKVHRIQIGQVIQLLFKMEVLVRGI